MLNYFYYGGFVLNKGKEVKLIPSDLKVVGINSIGIDMLSSGKRELKVSGLDFLRKEFLASIRAKGNLSLTNRFVSNNFGTQDFYYPLSLPFNNFFLFSSQRFSKMNFLLENFSNFTFFSLIGTNLRNAALATTNLFFSFFKYSFLFKSYNIEISKNFTSSRNLRKLYKKRKIRWLFFYKRRLPKYKHRTKYARTFENLIQLVTMKLIRFLDTFKPFVYMFNIFVQFIITKEMYSLALYDIVRKQKSKKFTFGPLLREYGLDAVMDVIGERVVNFHFKYTGRFVDTISSKSKIPLKYEKKYPKFVRLYYNFFSFLSKSFLSNKEVALNFVSFQIADEFMVFSEHFFLKEQHFIDDNVTNYIFYKRFLFSIFLTKIIMLKGVSIITKIFNRILIGIRKFDVTLDQFKKKRFNKLFFKKLVLLSLCIFKSFKIFNTHVFTAGLAVLFRRDFIGELTPSFFKSKIYYMTDQVDFYAKKDIFYKKLTTPKKESIYMSNLKRRLYKDLKYNKFKIRRLKRKLKRKAKSVKKGTQKKYFAKSYRHKRKRKLMFKFFRKMFNFYKSF